MTAGTQKISLVTGAAGFVGSHLVDALLARGEKVIGVDNFITGNKSNIEHLENDPNFSFIEQDISRPLRIEGDVHMIYDFACPASPTDFERYRMQIIHAGVFGVYNLLELAREKNARFVYSSSSEVYGDPEVHPQVETYNGNVNITGVRSVYDESKRIGETFCMAFYREYGVEPRIVRIFNTYGERMRADDGRAIPAFISQALKNEDMTIFGDGMQTRSIQYVSDLVAGVLLLGDSDVREPINIGTPHEYTMIELAEKIKGIAGSSSQIVFRDLPHEHDPKRRKADATKAKNLLGWEPKIGPDEGLEKTIAWFKEKLQLS